MGLFQQTSYRENEIIGDFHSPHCLSCRHMDNNPIIAHPAQLKKPIQVFALLNSKLSGFYKLTMNSRNYSAVLAGINVLPKK